MLSAAVMSELREPEVFLLLGMILAEYEKSPQAALWSFIEQFISQTSPGRFINVRGDTVVTGVETLTK